MIGLILTCDLSRSAQEKTGKTAENANHVNNHAPINDSDLGKNILINFLCAIFFFFFGGGGNPKTDFAIFLVKSRNGS